MSLEPGIRTWLPDQVYRHDRHATEILEYLIAQYKILQSPVCAPYVLGVCLADSGELIGHVGLSPLRGQVEIGFAIEEKHQGNGYATKAVCAMLQWGRKTFTLPVVLGIVASANVGSCRVLEKSGFILAKEEIGVLHNWHGIIRVYEWILETKED